MHKLQPSGGESLISGVAYGGLLLLDGRSRLRAGGSRYSPIVLRLGLGELRLASGGDLVRAVRLGSRYAAWRGQDRFVGLGALNTVAVAVAISISITIAVSSVRFVRAIVERKQFRVVQSEQTDWPWVDVVRITTAHSGEATVGTAAFGDGYAEQFLFGR